MTITANNEKILFLGDPLNGTVLRLPNTVATLTLGYGAVSGPQGSIGHRGPPDLPDLPGSTGHRGLTALAGPQGSIGHRGHPGLPGNGYGASAILFMRSAIPYLVYDSSGFRSVHVDFFSLAGIATNYMDFVELIDGAITELDILPCRIPDKLGGFAVGTPMGIFRDKLEELGIIGGPYRVHGEEKELISFKLLVEEIFPQCFSLAMTSMPRSSFAAYDYFDFFAGFLS